MVKKYEFFTQDPYKNNVFRLRISFLRILFQNGKRKGKIKNNVVKIKNVKNKVLIENPKSHKIIALDPVLFVDAPL